MKAKVNVHIRDEQIRVTGIVEVHDTYENGLQYDVTILEIQGCSKDEAQELLIEQFNEKLSTGMR